MMNIDKDKNKQHYYINITQDQVRNNHGTLDRAFWLSDMVGKQPAE